MNVYSIATLTRIDTGKDSREQEDPSEQRPPGRRSRPNILYIVVDDMGIADIGCYGNKTIPTPNVDRLCREGMKLTHHLSAYAICTPSRVSALTGRYASRAGLAQAPDTPPVVMYTASRTGLHENSTTWPKVLKENGYRTAFFGKWHLGWNKETWGDQKHGPIKHGFDYFFGTPTTLVDEYEEGAKDNFWSISRIKSTWLQDKTGVAWVPTMVKQLFSNNEHTFAAAFAAYLGSRTFRFGEGLPTLLFITGWWFNMQHMNIMSDKWWQRSDFMYWWLNSHIMEMPGNRIVMQPIDQKKSSSLINDKMTGWIDRARRANPSKPWLAFYSLTEAHTPLIVEDRFEGKSRHGAYGDTILQMDAMVGNVLNYLDRTGQTQNTLVYYTSDHGGHIDLGVKGGWNMPYRGGKGMAAREGGVRVPGIVRWPSKVRAGSTMSQPTSQMDLMPTFMEMVGIKHRIATLNAKPETMLDGRTMYRQLLGRSNVRIHDFLYHHCGIDIHAIRWHKAGGKVYKLVVKEPEYKKGRLSDGSGAHCGGFCPCFEDSRNQKVFTHAQPKLYRIDKDPGENNPLRIHSFEYRQNVPRMKREIEKQKEHEMRNNMRCQLGDMWRVLPAPWLQPCCNFPKCNCDKSMEPTPRDSGLQGFEDSDPQGSKDYVDLREKGELLAEKAKTTGEDYHLELDD